MAEMMVGMLAALTVESMAVLKAAYLDFLTADMTVGTMDERPVVVKVEWKAWIAVVQMVAWLVELLVAMTV